MPIEFNMPVPEMLRCMKVKLPLVLADVEGQVLVDNTTHMPEMAKKEDHIDVMVRDLEADPVFVHEDESHWSMSFHKKWPHHCCEKAGRAFVKKVIVHGTLHKQIYYVNQNDQVMHFGEDIPFTKMIELDEPEPVMDVDSVMVQFHNPKVDITWDLVRASRLQQTGVIIVKVKVVEERQIFIAVCPPFEECPKGNLLRDPSFEQWIGDIPVAWGAVNVLRCSANPHSGSFAVRLGANVNAQAAVFQIIRRITPGHSYRLCFWARRDTLLGVTPVCDFIVTASVIYYDAEGNVLANLQHEWDDSSIGVSWTQLCFDAGPPPEEVSYAQVFIAFRPEAGNTACFVVIDDASLVCIR